MTMANDAGKDGPPSLDEFSKRLDRARGEANPETPRGAGKAWGSAFRVSSDLLAGLFVGTVLGLILDRVLGTQPWLLLLGMILGFGAGVRNVYRTMAENDAASKKDD